MTRTEYMKSLEELLASLPETERRDALDYYDEYFDAAGKSRESETIAELGSPEEVAQKILENQDFVPAEAPSAPIEPDPSSKRPVKNHRSHWTPIAACALLAVAGLAFVGAHLPFRRIVPATANVLETGTSNSPTYSHLAVENNAADSSSSFHVSLDRLKNLTLDLDIGDVNFIPEKGLTDARIEYQNRDSHFESDFVFKDSGSYFNYKEPKGFNFNVKDTLKDMKKKFTLTIYLPEGFEMNKLDATLDMGDLSLGSLKVKDLTAELDMGSFTADDLTTRTADFDLDMGNFTVSSLTAETADIELSMGNLTIRNANAHDFTVSNDMGDIEVGLLTGAQKIDLDADTGTIELTVDGFLSDYGVDAENDFGTLRIDGKKYSERFQSSGNRKLTLSNDMGSTTLNFQKQ